MKLFRIVRSNIASLLITKKVPRRLDAAPVNTKTMCLITKLLYKTNLKSLIVVGLLFNIQDSVHTQDSSESHSQESA